ncbi:MAG: hypothetical protein L6263_02885 [Desulfobacteraceae bacterium]|nr:hypothetical protein [Pseudomonadota bacterium]MCG2757365.1 hypothetical protein [Desulfobacteraceae bacterium]
MPYNDDICKLVIENIALLEEAPMVIEKIEKNIFKEINGKFEAFFENYDNWEGCYSYREEDHGETTVKPPKWPGDEVAWHAFYSFSNDPDDECNYPLTALLGATSLDMYAIYFCVDENNLCGMKRNPWKDFLKKQYNARPDLKASGVQLEGECLSIPIRLDPKAVAAEYPDFDECLKPIDDAINTLMKVHPLIDEIVQEALRQKKSEA